MHHPKGAEMLFEPFSSMIQGVKELLMLAGLIGHYCLPVI
jgi:hypothetical protein